MIKLLLAIFSHFSNFDLCGPFSKREVTLNTNSYICLEQLQAASTSEQLFQIMVKNSAEVLKNIESHCSFDTAEANIA